MKYILIALMIVIVLVSSCDVPEKIDIAWNDVSWDGNKTTGSATIQINGNNSTTEQDLNIIDMIGD